MIRLVLAGLLAGLANLATAQNFDLPALFDVTGVTQEDVLNIRQNPTADAPIVGSFGPKDKNIEVITVTATGTWGQVNGPEQSGWVAMRFLDRQPHFGFPRLTQCFGTEPFWSLAFDGSQITLTTPDGAPQTQGHIWRTQAAGLTGVYGFGAGPWVAAVRGQSCNDGMSDRAFGLTVDLLLGRGPGTMMLSGCCTLAK
ncbi:MAG: SH3 domain-containing protein [Pseudomonadota bacterium]